MEIKVNGIVIETREITEIHEKVRDRFWNRYCGFTIHRHKKPPLDIEWTIPYESYPREIADKKERCRALMQEVITEWEKDKVIYPKEKPIKEFNL